MLGPATETVGEKFSPTLLETARDKTLAVINEAAALVRPGMTEAEARQLIADIQTRMGAPKNWHSPQIRFGRNTLCVFAEKGEENVVLKDNDIFFFDIGPIFEDHEGDVGRPFAVGTNDEMHRCCTDAEAIWHEVRSQWLETGKTGGELYTFAAEAAKARGWELVTRKANGHRIADFPHAAKARGSIEHFADHPASHRWILEIQIAHPSQPFGAFYEDLLA